ncbi:MAG: tRNA epoxyqueuosine(34) reductase QueG [Thermoguttaceae bacterium]
MNDIEFTHALKDEARRLGFELVGAAPAAVGPAMERLKSWLAEGFAGRMGYFADRLDAYGRLELVLDGVRSVLMLGMNYRTVEPIEPGPGQLRVSRYAWGGDYHELIRDRLHRLADFHRRCKPQAGVRTVVDTAPLLERHFAQQAGLGWIGKNTMLINETFGSWIFLAGLLTTEPLAFDRPVEDRCGSCRQCLDACPGGALVGPRRLDARRCVSYLTVELRGPIDPELRRVCDGRLFGCDACQEACPWNRQTPVSREPVFRPGEGMNPVDWSAMAAMDDESFRRRFRHTPLWRARREGILRNASL